VVPDHLEKKEKMKKYFLTGLAILLPLAVTVAVLNFLINLLTKPFIGIVSSIVCKIPFPDNHTFLFNQEHVILYTSKVLILITLFLFTIFLGIVTRWFVVKELFQIGDKILHRIPVINTVYKTTQDIMKTLLSSDKKSFKQVVMVPFPRHDTFVIGLVARDAPEICSSKTTSDLVSVLIPTTPNPTTGFLLMYPRKDLVLIDMKPEDAIKYIVSCGVIIPPPTPSTL
jgi:uncharacterized membrane protein